MGSNKSLYLERETSCISLSSTPLAAHEIWRIKTEISSKFSSASGMMITAAASLRIGRGTPVIGLTGSGRAIVVLVGIGYLGFRGYKDMFIHFFLDLSFCSDYMNQYGQCLIDK